MECQSKVPTETHDHHCDQGSHRDDRHDISERDDENQQEDAGEERGDAGAGTRDLDVDHGLTDHRVAAHAAEEA